MAGVENVEKMVGTREAEAAAVATESSGRWRQSPAGRWRQSPAGRGGDETVATAGDETAATVG